MRLLKVLRRRGPWYNEHRSRYDLGSNNYKKEELDTVARGSRMCLPTLLLWPEIKRDQNPSPKYLQSALRGMISEREARRGDSSQSYGPEEQRSDPRSEPQPKGIGPISTIPASDRPRRIARDTASSSFLGLVDIGSYRGRRYCGDGF